MQSLRGITGPFCFPVAEEMCGPMERVTMFLPKIAGWNITVPYSMLHTAAVLAFQLAVRAVWVKIKC